MHTHPLGNLFVSYSHADKASMLAVRKHLQGILFDRVQVWTDDDIPEGLGWDAFLMKNLDAASSALVLASPDYLVSSWCRKELRHLAAAYRRQRVKRVFWVQVRPCGWNGTELAQFQSWEENVAQAVSEYADEIQRDRALVRLCEKIASETTRSITEGDEDLAFVRRLLLDAPEDRNLTVESVIGRGNFAIVCRGRVSGSIDAVFKVLTRTPIEKMSDAFVRIGKARQQIDHASFIRIHDLFQVGPAAERRTIIVSEFMGYAQLSSAFDRAKEAHGHERRMALFDVDLVAALVRRTAEGLTALHEVSAKGGLSPRESTLGFFNVDNIYYDARSERLRLAAFGVASFLWQVFDPSRFAEWVTPSAGSNHYVAPEQSTQSGAITPLTDQYMLGLLALELLEGTRIGDMTRAGPVTDVWKNPAALVTGAWKEEHPQLWTVVSRLLAEDPAARWANMAEVVEKLRSLEDESRALAKHIYRVPQPRKGGGTFRLEDCNAFFEEFYRALFTASPSSRDKFDNIDQQHQKLMAAMVSVLNFREGNKPTSLDAFLDIHRRKGITADEFDQFREVFRATMERFTDDPRVVKAWDDLFRPVVEYMKAECAPPVGGVTRPSESGAKDPSNRKRSKARTARRVP
jgi:serine/threonine protein kinase